VIKLLLITFIFLRIIRRKRYRQRHIICYKIRLILIRNKVLKLVVITELNSMSASIFWDVCTKKTVEVDGESKDIWLKAGVIKVTPYGKKYLQLYQQPNTDFFIFEPRDEELPEID